jgi:GT2 family glycosyltransferase
VYEQVTSHVQAENLALSRYREASKDILIVVRDQLDYLRQCIDSVQQFTRNFHLYIWDNGSGAATQAYLRDLKLAHQGAVDVVRVESNRGCVEPNNQLAALGSGEYLILLNSDTKMSEGWDQAMIGWLQAHPECASVGYMGVVLDEEGEYRTAGFGDGIDFVAGWCACISRATYQEFGLFDPHFQFSHWEDADLGLRLQAAGKSTYALHLGLVHHYWHKTTQALPAEEKIRLDRYAVDNFNYFRQKWKPHIETGRAELRADYVETSRYGRGIPFP